MKSIEKVSREYHDTAISKKSKEIAKLRAERDEYKDKAHSLNRDRASARDAVFKEGLARIEAEKQLASARAALDGERERALTEAATYAFRLDWNSDPKTALAQVWHWLRSRAAEAKASRGGEGGA